MPLVQPQPIAALPPAPYTDAPNFEELADAHLAAWPGFRAQTNAAADATWANAGHAQAQAQAAQDSATQSAQAANAAAQSVAAAAAAANATQWAAGTQYAAGAVVWSPANYLNYRRRAAGAGATDPSQDSANWALIGAPLAAPMQSIAANTQAQAGMHYLITATLTLTLPAAPAVRDTVRFTNLTGQPGSVIDPGGALIRGTAGAMTLDVPGAAATLIYSGPTKGWV